MDGTREDNIEVSEVAQAKNDKYRMLSLLGDAQLQIFRCEYISCNKYRNKENVNKLSWVEGWGLYMEDSSMTDWENGENGRL